MRELFFFFVNWQRRQNVKALNYSLILLSIVTG